MAENAENSGVAPKTEQPKTQEVSEVPPRIPLPPNWTILYHGSNLGRDEWQGEKRNVLDSDLLINQARGSGLSCITETDKQKEREEGERTGAYYDTTGDYSTVGEGGNDEPLEIRIAFPAFHSRNRLAGQIRGEYTDRYGEERTREIIALADTVHWKTSQRHPVVPRGVRLTKLQDYKFGNKRVISYVPEVLKDVYERELSLNQVGN